MKWNREEEYLLRNLLEAGLSYTKIAQILRRSINSVTTQAKRLGYRVKQNPFLKFDFDSAHKVYIDTQKSVSEVSFAENYLIIHYNSFCKLLESNGIKFEIREGKPRVAWK